MVMSKAGLLNVPVLCVAAAAGLVVIALVYLGKPESRDWLHSTVPGFITVGTQA